MVVFVQMSRIMSGSCAFVTRCRAHVHDRPMTDRPIYTFPTLPFYMCYSIGSLGVSPVVRI